MGTWFETIVELLQNPFFLLLAVVFAIIILVAVVKKLVKLAMVVVAVFIIYIAYLVWTGQDVAESIDGLQESVEKTFSAGKDKVGEVTDELTDRAARRADSTVHKQVEKILGDDESKSKPSGD